MLEQILRSAARKAAIACGAAIALALMAQPRVAYAQQATPRRDSALARHDYKDLDALLAALPSVDPPAFGEAEALWLGSLPLSCIDRLQPRPGRQSQPAPAPATAPQASNPAAATGTRPNTGADYFWVATYELIPNHKRTRAFWGCNDWHSAVASTWAAASIRRTHPRLGLDELAREKLNDHLGKSNLEGELTFFREAAGTFERPYGYAWLLKLHGELLMSPDSQGKRWADNVAPLARWMADSLVAHLNAMPRPVRTGSINNTAAILTLARDYAIASNDAKLRTALDSTARRFYTNDRDCDTLLEVVPPPRAPGADAPRSQGPQPAGATAVLSPCLAVASLMSQLMEPITYAGWLTGFLPPMHTARFEPITTAPGEGTTGSDRARLAALAFNRAQALETIARGLPSIDTRTVVLRRLSAVHASRGFELLRDDTSGTHWVPPLALLYLTARSGR